MGKHSNKEAYFKRLQELAQVSKKASINETNGRTLGTLIDFKTAADGYTYGIVKENHHYYIKKSNKSSNPDVTDFAYIGGLGNITEFQYSKLSEADKNRNMILNTISEAYSRQLSKTSSKTSKKKMLSEGVDEDAEEEIAQAEDKMGDLEAVAVQAKPTPAPEMPDVGTKEFPEAPAEEPAPDMGGEEMPDLEGLGLDDEGGEESPAEEPEGEEGLDPQDQESLVVQEIEKSIGKLGNRIRKTQLTDSQTNSYLKQLINPFKEHLKDLEIEDRKEIADLILKTVPDEYIEDLDVSGEDEEELAENKEMCAECGSFVQYAESRGYTSESILEATNEEIANLAGGYINAHKDGMNEGDFASVGTHLTAEAFDMLKEEYGFDDEDLSEYQTALKECGNQDRKKKVDEFWGGMKSLAKGAGQAIAKGAQSVGQAAKGAGQAIADKTKQAGQVVVDKAKEAGQGIKQQYYKGEINPHVDKMEKAAKELQQALNSYNSVLQKAGQQPVQINDLLADIFGGIGTPSTPLTKAGKEMTPQQKAVWQKGKGAQPAGVNLSQYRNEGEELKENLDDAAKVEVQPTFAQESQTLGIAINEAEKKIRKYVRQRLEEKMGLRKSKINESAKSESLKKLDALIEKQFKLYETVVKKSQVK